MESSLCAIPGGEFCQSDCAPITDTCEAAHTVTGAATRSDSHIAEHSRPPRTAGRRLQPPQDQYGGALPLPGEAVRDQRITSATVQLVLCGNIPCFSQRSSEVLWPIGNPGQLATGAKEWPEADHASVFKFKKCLFRSLCILHGPGEESRSGCARILG